MFYPQSDSASEVKRDQLLQSSLAYWSASPHAAAGQDPQAWEAGVPFEVKAGPWVWFLLAIIIALTITVIVL